MDIIVFVSIRNEFQQLAYGSSYIFGSSNNIF